MDSEEKATRLTVRLPKDELGQRIVCQGFAAQLAAGTGNAHKNRERDIDQHNAITKSDRGHEQSYATANVFLA